MPIHTLCSTELKKNFYRHTKICSRKAPVPTSKIFVTSTNTLEVNQLQDWPNSFKENILETLLNDGIGNLCRKDNTILTLRNVFYGRIKKRQTDSGNSSSLYCFRSSKTYSYSLIQIHITNSNSTASTTTTTTTAAAAASTTATTTTATSSATVSTTLLSLNVGLY